MKKFLILALSSALILASLAGCGGSEETGSPAASRGVRNFGTPGGKLGCVSQQRLNGFRV